MQTAQEVLDALDYAYMDEAEWHDCVGIPQAWDAFEEWSYKYRLSLYDGKYATHNYLNTQSNKTQR